MFYGISQSRPVSSPPASQSVADLLRVPPLDAGVVMAAGDGLDEREVTWVAVIEWPVEDFVDPGELVLTTGVGCDEAMFEQLVEEIAAAGAAALCVSVGADAPFCEVSAAVRAIGERRGMPIVALPWSVRFADVLRTVADRVLAARYATVLDPRAQLPLPLSEALLRRDALHAIVNTVEAMTQQAAVVLDDALAIAASGPRAERLLGTTRIAAQPARARALDSAAVLRLHELLNSRVQHDAPGIAALDLPAARVRSAAVQGRIAGFVLLLGGDGPPAPQLDGHALDHAATAVAIEMLRRSAAREAEEAMRGDLLWELADGADGADQALATRAALLRYALDAAYVVALARLEPEATTTADGEEPLDRIVREARRIGAGDVLASRRGVEVLVLVPDGGTDAAALARQLSDVHGGGHVRWGVADTPAPLRGLADAYRLAERALRVGRSLSDADEVAIASELASLLMLADVARDPQAVALARGVMQPLLNYDRNTSRGLVETLETYLAEHGNTTAAARRLHLNRHSLLYRLRKIEELSGRDLARHEDRYLLETSLRLLRLGAV